MDAHILHTNNNTRLIHTKIFSNSIWAFVPEVSDDDDDWGSTYLTETSTHYHVCNAWDYYKNVFGRTGMDGTGLEIRMFTQKDDPEAYYNSNIGFPGIIFGKDSGWDWGMEPSLAAHEFSHGVIHHTSDLEYSYQSGALNESFCDIFGIVIQAVMLDGGLTDWIYGNHVPTVPTRSLIAPKTDGKHYDEFGAIQVGQPDTYEGEYWYTGDLDDGGVHVNSGVSNKWFYILTEGEEGYNDLSNHYDITGIGMTKAARIAYYAFVGISQESVQFSDIRAASIFMAKFLYGECSDEYQATIDAWYAVGVGSANNCTYTLSNNKFEEEDVLVYPNPTNHYLQIELPYEAKGYIQIYDMTGKLVSEFENNEIKFQTDVSTFDNGLYIIQINTDDNIITKRFVVQK